MDEVERVALEHEVQQHLAKVEELLAALRDLEENLQHVLDPPKELRQQISAIKGELRGRMAAIAVGEGRLGVDPF
jgi:predicted  nucleic acid-binding Zn-ribbon protein